MDVLYEGAKLEVKCDLGYTIDGPSYVYCNEDLEWNEELKGCKGEQTCMYISTHIILVHNTHTNID